MTETIGQRLRRQREALGRSHRSIATEIGVGFPYLSKLEHDRHIPSPTILQRLAVALGDDFDELTIVAGRVPDWASESMVEDPAAAIDALRNFVVRPR
jgi:HTH-type transcriptional regulator, competence development regulator